MSDHDIPPMRSRIETIPDPLTESHAELDGKVRVRARTTQQEDYRRATIQRWLDDDEWTRRLMGRIYDVLEEQTTSNVRVSRLERQRNEDAMARSDLLAVVRQEADATRAHVDRANIGRRKVRLREVAVILGLVFTGTVTTIGALQGRSETAAIEEMKKLLDAATAAKK
jgi:hypothetical protein